MLWQMLSALGAHARAASTLHCNTGDTTPSFVSLYATLDRWRSLLPPTPREREWAPCRWSEHRKNIFWFSTVSKRVRKCCKEGLNWQRGPLFANCISSLSKFLQECEFAELLPSNSDLMLICGNKDVITGIQVILRMGMSRWQDLKVAT